MTGPGAAVMVACFMVMTAILTVLTVSEIRHRRHHSRPVKPAGPDHYRNYIDLFVATGEADYLNRALEYVPGE